MDGPCIYKKVGGSGVIFLNIIYRRHIIDRKWHSFTPISIYLVVQEFLCKGY
jgi:hypothetical protein